MCSEEWLVRHCFQKKILVLGTCLGSQLAAKALGDGVYLEDAAEAGFCHDLIPDTSLPLSVYFS